MGKCWALNTLLLLTVITVTRGQYYDILQGLQQLFQPYQGSDFVTQYNAVTRNPVTHRQESKKKNSHRNQHEERRTKKPPTNQYDYLFATTEKPSRKTTKSNSSQSNSNPRNIATKNQYSNILVGQYYNPFEATTKAKIRVKPTTTTTEANYVNNFYENANNVNRATTENVFSNVNFNNRVPSNNFNINRPVTENAFENVNRKENYVVNAYQPGNVFENQNNRKPINLNTNNYPRVPNNRDFPQNINSNLNNNNPGNNNRNNNVGSNTRNNNNDRGILNTDYNNAFPSLPTNTRNPSVFGVSNAQNDNRGIANNNRGIANNNRGIVDNNRNTNNFGLTNPGFINTGNNPVYPNNFGSTTEINEYNRERPNNRVVPNEYDRRVTSNNFGNTGVDYNNRGNTFSTNNRGTTNNYNTNDRNFNTNDRGSTNNFNVNDRGNANNFNTNDRGNANNFNTNDRGNANNFNTNDRGNPNNFNTNNRGNSNNFNTNDRGNPNNFNTNQGNSNNFNYPSDNPLINRPGVQPAVVDVGQPPITNRPVQSGSNFVVFNRPTDPGSITYTEGPETEPEILIGPDEDDMTEGQKRRYVDLAERMCNRYKALTERKIVALPLVPSPDPVELNVSDCTPINVPLVIGGKVVSIRDFPHMALVGWMKIRNAGYSWKCGGSLISNQYILTAGHCTYQDKDYDAISGPPQAVQLGSSYLDDPGALVVKVSAVIRHLKYKMRRAYHDIALIKMVSKVTFSEVIRPACLGVPPPEGNSIIATGWGRTEFGGDHSLELRSVSLPVWNMEECREIWGTSLKLPNGVTPDSHVCAGEKRGGKDTCQGDSGGPAQTQDGCQWRVVAVTSYGRSCGAPHTPALYATIPRAFVAAQVFTDQR